MPAPTDRKYLESHEWHLAQGDTVSIGITQFAADELTDVTYVGLPKIGAAVKAGQKFGDIESVKTSSDLISGVTGTVTEVNAELNKNPGLVNSDPYGGAWMIRVKASDLSEMDLLLPADEYLKKVAH